MNELIKELARNHLVRYEYTESGYQCCHKYEFDPDELQKFAELIVQDCVTICNNANGASYLNGVYAGRQIKEHFGVE